MHNSTCTQPEASQDGAKQRFLGTGDPILAQFWQNLAFFAQQGFNVY